MAIIFSFFLPLLMVLFAKVARESVCISLDKCEELPPLVCPACDSENLIKNGSIHNGKSKYQCKICSRQFVANPTKTLSHRKSNN